MALVSAGTLGDDEALAAVGALVSTTAGDLDAGFEEEGEATAAAASLFHLVRFYMQQASFCAKRLKMVIIFIVTSSIQVVIAQQPTSALF